MIHISKVDNIHLHLGSNPSSEKDIKVNDSEKMEELVNLLRIKSKDPFFMDKTVLIPDNSENQGFVEGNHNLSNLLHFLADMLEE